jgi:arylsulfatase A-like enzyme
LHAFGGLLRTQFGLTEQSNQVRPRARDSLPVVLSNPMGQRPNVLFLILESVRADAVCIEYDERCKSTPFSNRLVPERFPFTQMRSQASSTAISLAVLWSGVGPHESRDVLHTWPLIFDYARAAGYDTAFWTSQNMMFGNSRLWVKNLGVSQFVSATELDPVADLDMGAPEHLLARHVVNHVRDLQEPFLAVVQFSNVHYPYLVDESGPMPFQPSAMSKGPDDNEAFFNQYLNAVHQQDRHVAAILEGVQGMPFGDRTVVVYTSDHGEAFREHNQMGHTFSVFDEEIHVPAWVSAPAGTLSAEQRKSLREKKDAFSFHADVAATVVDLLGVLDDPGVARYREKMIGKSLLRPELNLAPMPMTNCAGVWSCAFENWGYMQEGLKIEARAWGTNFHCYDILVDPREKYDLDTEECRELERLTLRTFGRLPGGQRED